MVWRPLGPRGFAIQVAALRRRAGRADGRSRNVPARWEPHISSEYALRTHGSAARPITGVVVCRGTTPWSSEHYFQFYLKKNDSKAYRRTCHFWWDCTDAQTSNMTGVLKLLHQYAMNDHVIMTFDFWYCAQGRRLWFHKSALFSHRSGVPRTAVGSKIKITAWLIMVLAANGSHVCWRLEVIVCLEDKGIP